jgi:uncharacterized repeat protein (TIGR01451 family)
VFTISGESSVNSIEWDPAGNLYYLSPTNTYFAHFGTLALGASSATATRIQPYLPGAHGMAFDPYTGNMMIFGANYIYQAAVTRTNFTIVSQLDLGGRGIIDLDLGQVDGKGHLFVADHSGYVVFLDYSQTRVINHPANYMQLAYLDAHLDDVAPTQLRGSTNVADLVMDLSFTPEAWAPGTPVTLTIKITNRGPGAATGVQAVAPFPPETTIRSIDPSQGKATVTNGTLICDVGSLLNGGTAKVAVDFISATDTPFRERATVTAMETDPVFVNNTQAVLRYPFYIANLLFAANGPAIVQVSAEPNRSYTLQSTTNFAAWTSVTATNPLTTPFTLADPRGIAPRLFYRVVRQ